jgi:hypothetical protein
MALLTTTGGLDYYFDPDSVEAVADYNLVAQKNGTTVYGIGPNPLDIHDSPTDFIDRIGRKDAFVRFASPDDHFVWIKASEVSYVRPPTPREFGLTTTKTVIVVGSGPRPVSEELKDVVAKLRDKGVPL